MIEKDGFLIFECDKDEKGREIINYSQKNNGLVFPNPKTYPNAQYVTNWKNTCNVTSYVMALDYAGAKFPTGPYSQDEDNLGYFILTNKDVLDAYKENQPVMYNTWQRSILGKCTKAEIEKVGIYPPNELHDYISLGANLWLGYSASKFSINVNFKKALWENMVRDNLPLVISTTFGGLGHIVCVTGVEYKKDDYVALNSAESIKASNFDELLNATNPVGIIVDDPWGKYNPKTNKYDAPNGGNDIFIPWDVVISRVKPAKSTITKWCHTFKHGMATI